MIELILNVSFMFSGCLGALDSNGIDDVVDHEYETLPRVRYSHTWKILKYWWPTVTISRSRAQLLINLYDQVNTSLGPSATKHSMMTQHRDKKQRYPGNLKLTKKNDNIKRKEAEEFFKLEVNFERLKKEHKSMS